MKRREKEPKVKKIREKITFKGFLKKIKRSFTTRYFKVGGYSVALIAVTLAIVIALNILINALPTSSTQVDMTANDLYSVSTQTEDMLAKLEEDITFYWIVQSGSEDDTLEIVLSRYESLTSHITVEKKDPDVYPTFASQYTDSTVNNNSILVMCGDTYRYLDYYDIYEYDYSDYYYSGSYDVAFNGEGALTGAIDYVTSDNLPTVYLLTGHGEEDLSDTFSEAITDENITTESLSLLTVDEIPEDADCILINNPASDLSAEEKDMLTDFIDNGGNILLITDLPEDGEDFTNWNALGEYYGISTVNGIVIEGNRSNYAFQMPYYLLPDIGSHTITDPLIDEGYYVLLSAAQGLKINETDDETLTVTELLSTSDDAFSKSAGWNLKSYEKEDTDEDGPFSLGVIATKTVDGETNGNLVWFSSSSLVNEQLNQQVSGGNEDLFVNAIGYMCEKEDSISIHTKSINDYSYLTMDTGVATLFTVLVVGILPLSYLVIGIYIWIRRKNR